MEQSKAGSRTADPGIERLLFSASRGEAYAIPATSLFSPGEE
jgi:hypothetical protein